MLTVIQRIPGRSAVTTHPDPTPIRLGVTGENGRPLIAASLCWRAMYLNETPNRLITSIREPFRDGARVPQHEWEQLRLARPLWHFPRLVKAAERQGAPSDPRAEEADASPAAAREVE